MANGIDMASGTKSSSKLIHLRPSSLDFTSSTPISQDKNEFGKRRRMGSSTCSRCDDTITYSSDSFYSCSVCDLDFCVPCTGISSAMHQALQESKENNLLFTCKTCKQTFPSISKVNRSLSNLDRKNDIRLDNLESKIDNLEISLNRKIYNEVQSLKEGVVEEVSSTILDKLKTEVRAEVREIDDQKSRTMNMVIFNLPESVNTNSDERKQDDISLFLVVCKSIGVENVEVNIAFRLGNKRDNYNRPLKVILENKKTRREIIENAKHIELKAPDNLKRVVMVKDLTPKQRVENKKRRMENRQRLGNGRNNRANVPDRNGRRERENVPDSIRAHNDSSRNLFETTDMEIGMETQNSTIRNAYTEDTIIEPSQGTETGGIPPTVPSGGPGGSPGRNKD